MNSLARSAIRHPRAWIGLVLLAATLSGAGAARLVLRTEGAALEPAADATVRASALDRLRFQDPPQLVLLVAEREHGPALVSHEGLRFVADLHERLRALSGVRSAGVLSIAGLARLERGGAGFAVGSYLDDLPDDDAALALLVEQLRGRSITDGLLLSRDGRLAAFYLPLSERGEPSEHLAEVEGLLRALGDAPFELLLTGPLVAETTLGRMVLADLALFVPVMVGLIALLLWLVLGDPGSAAVCMLEAALVLVCTFGIMGWAGAPVTLVTTILPVVLMTMAITDEIHLLERVKAQLAERALPDAVLAAVEQVRVPIVATSITTALGFLSFLSASIEPVRQFGLFTALGILLAMGLSFCWVPALIVVLPRRWFATSAPRPGASRFDAPARWAGRHPGAALGCALLAVAIAAPGIARLRVQDSWVGNFADDSELVRADRALNAAFWGSYRFDVVFEARAPYFYSPAAARLLEAFTRVAAGAPHVGGVLSYRVPLAEVAGALELEGPVSELSATRIADVLAVAQMSESRLLLRGLLTEDGAAARVRLFVRSPDYQRSLELRRYLEARLPQLLAGEPVRWRFSGDLPVAEAVVAAVVSNQLLSIGWTLATVALVLVLGFVRGIAGLVALAPVVAAIALLFGVMGHAGVALGIATSMFASLAVGVGVDFAIHFLHRYRIAARDAGGERAAAETLATTGRALRWNAGVLSCGFLVLTLSSLGPNRSLGALLAGAMIACYAMTMLLLPCLARVLPVAGALLLGLLPAVAGAAGPSCPIADEPGASAVMAALEARFRSEPRIVRMHIDTSYPQGHRLHEYFAQNPSPKLLWGAIAGDPSETRLLYVFSGPGRLAGTALLIHDEAGRDDDAMWLYLRSFDSFTRLEPGARQVVVPGTVLTYEDARGFLPTDSYHFALREERVGPSELAVLACPRTEQVRQALGYHALEVVVDRARELVLRVRYLDLGRKPLKTWQLVEAVQVEGAWYAGRVRMEHLAEGRVTRLAQEHWRLSAPPGRDLFDPAQPKSFLARLRALLEREGHGERIGAELREADERVRAYDEHMRQLEEQGARP